MYNPTNFHKKVISHSAFLINKKEHSMATGVFIKYNELYFILTVAHILQETEPEDILINLGISGQQYPMKKEQYWKEDRLDIAYMKLNSFEVKIFQNKVSPFIIQHKQLRDISNDSLRCAICGYPSSMAYKKDSHTTVGETFMVTTRPILPEQWPKEIIENGKNPKDHFLLKYGSKHSENILDQEGEQMELLNPKGLSGAGVWIFDQNSENDEQPKYALFGIQTGFYRDSQLLVGTKVESLFKQIELDFGKINIS